jgi:L-iditol 2-dehydrogenase
VRGIERAAVRPGDSVCILGAGSNGLMLGQLAQLRGAPCVMIVDPIAYRRQRALEVGIDFALDPAAGPLLEQIQAINNGRRPDVVIVTPSKIAVMQQGIELVGAGGTVLLFAPSSPAEILPVQPNSLFFQEISLRTSYSAGPYETRQALELLRSRRVGAETLITHRLPLGDAARAFEMVAHPGDALKVVITSSPTL